ncbi:adenylate/guanylate cyclase domain-containing protein (plasmid) [Ensifer sp. D2-11]
MSEEAIQTAFHASHGDRVLAAAQRNGFRLAVIGRSIAVTVLAFTFLAGYQYPANVQIWGVTLLLGLGGLAVLTTLGRPWERAARHIYFAVDVAVVSALIAFAPLSSGDDIPQNLVFLTSRADYYYLIVAASVLTLSPGLVLWTGFCCAFGLGLATYWIAQGMQRVVTFSDLPYAPSREIFFQTVLSPNFLGTASRLEEALILVAVTSIVAIAVGRARSVVLARVAAEERRRNLQRQFGRYVPASVIANLEKDGQLAPQLRDATLLYADVEGFTAISEKLPPAEIINLLNELFSAVSEVVTRHGGMIVNYFGDAVIAAFNAPLPSSDHELQAVLAARDILTLVSSRDFTGNHLRLRIGIATGPIAAGTVGSDERLSFTLYGDTVNLAQRLEALNKELGTSCLICGATYHAVRDRVRGLRPLGPHSVRNRDQPVAIYVLDENTVATETRTMEGPAPTIDESGS